MVLRQPIYEFDRMTPASPVPVPALDAELLARFPEGYRHLAYVQTLVGYEVKRDMPGLDGPELERLYEHGAQWLRGLAAASPAHESAPQDRSPRNTGFNFAKAGS
jgi:hypothetical protein